MSIRQFLILVNSYSLTIFILIFINLCGHTQILHSFPTRRSSDLNIRPDGNRAATGVGSSLWGHPQGRNHCCCKGRSDRVRSEEHTSELQSHSDLVCRLLLEKKKNTHNIYLIVDMMDHLHVVIVFE